MTRYLSMITTDIRQFIDTQCCDTLLELQEAARRSKLEIKLQLREQRLAPTQSQLTPERSKTSDSRSVGQLGCTCGKCGKVHSVVFRSGNGCHECGKWVHLARDYRPQTPASGVRLCYYCE